MACCIIAAYLASMAMAMVRRWLAFLGLARPIPGESTDTIYHRIGRQFDIIGRRIASRTFR